MPSSSPEHWDSFWLLLWQLVARPPFLPEHKRGKLKIQWPDFTDRRVWVIMSSFGLGGLALGVVGYLSPLYLNRVLGLSQVEVSRVVWIPFVGWEIGYFFWGWIADRYAANTDRPKNIFLLLTLLGLPTAFVTMTHSVPITIALFFWATFVADGFVVLEPARRLAHLPQRPNGYGGGHRQRLLGAVQFLILPLYGRWFDGGWHTWCFVSMSLLPAVGTRFSGCGSANRGRTKHPC